MSEREPFSWAARARSFGFAFRGVVTLLATQHNAWIHAAATVVVVGLGVALGVEPPRMGAARLRHRPGVDGGRAQHGARVAV